MDEERGPVVLFSGGGTGGHLYPALALADGLRARRPDVRAFFVGAERGIESRVLPERGEEHLLLPVEGFPRGAPLPDQLRVVPPLVRSVARTASLVRRLRPEAAVVTGGYAGGPAGVVAALAAVPLALQEQNSVPGLVTRALSRWADQIHVAFPEARERLPGRVRERVRVTGNPVRPPAALSPGEARRRFGVPVGDRLVLATGGSQGSEALNALLAAAVRSATASGAWPTETHLLWSTGPDRLEEVRDALGREVPSWIHLEAYIDDMPAALAAADLALSRAGAMATSEFLARGLPAVLVPLPTSAAGHQEANARALDRAGAAVHLSQEGLTGEALLASLVGLLDDPERLEAMARAAADRGRPRATDEIAAALETLLAGSRGGRR